MTRRLSAYDFSLCSCRVIPSTSSRAGARLGNGLNEDECMKFEARAIGSDTIGSSYRHNRSFLPELSLLITAT
jgi:hypothetical protein